MVTRTLATTAGHPKMIGTKFMTDVRVSSRPGSESV
jgi:hypothetical protein